MNRLKEYILVVIFFIFIISILFNKVIFGNFVFASGDTLAPQAVKQGLKNIIELNGNFPNWYPFIFSGMPTVHSLLNINEYYFPHKIVQWLNQLGLPWIWNFLFHYLFGSIGMYSLLRFFKLDKIVAIFGSFLFILSPYMVAYLVHGHGSQIMTAVYIPWILLFLFKIYQDVNIFNYSILSLLIGLQLQRGHIQIAYYTWMMIGLYVLIKLIDYFLYRSINYSFKDFIKRKIIILSSIFVGFLTSLSIYIPVLNYSQYSVRGASNGGFGIDNATQWSLSFNEIITFILPYSLGFGGKGYWGSLPFTDFPNYIGIIIFILAIVGIINTKLHRQYNIFLILTIIISLCISLGKNFIDFYSIFYNYLPYFDKFRAPIFILIIFQFCIYIYASIGLSAIHKVFVNARLKKYFLFLIIFVVLTIIPNFNTTNNLYPKHKINDNVELLNNIKLTFTKILDKKDLNNDSVINFKDREYLDVLLNDNSKIYFSYLEFINSSQTSDNLLKILEEVSSDYNFYKSSLIIDNFIVILFLLIFILVLFFYFKTNYLSKKYFFSFIIIIVILDYFRINYDIINPILHNPHRHVLKESKYLDAFLNEDEVIKFLNEDISKYRILDLTGNNQSRWAAFNIESVNGYHPAKIASYDKLLTQINNLGYWPKGILENFNIKYLIHRQKGEIPGFTRVGNNFNFNFFNNNDQDFKKIKVHIYQNNNYNDRLFFVENVILLNKNDEIFNKMLSEDFKPIKESYINLNDLNKNQVTDLNFLKNNNIDNLASIELLEWSSDKIIFKTSSSTKKLLLLSEIFYPGWSVKDDNDKYYDLYKINNLFRGFVIDSGENIYTMYFDPNDIKNGNIISRFSYLYIFLLLLLYFIRRKKLNEKI